MRQSHVDTNYQNQKTKDDRDVDYITYVLSDEVDKLYERLHSSLNDDR